MNEILVYLKTTAVKHVLFIALAVGVFIAGRSWLTEHDARLQSEAAVKTAQTTIASLEAQQATVTKQAAAQVVILRQDAAAVQTAPEAVTALTSPVAAIAPEVTPLSVEALPDAPSRVSVSALPLFQELSSCKEDSINLGACTATLGLEKQIDGQKDLEITALKKKPGFWHRVKAVAIDVGIGVAVGYALHK